MNELEKSEKCLEQIREMFAGREDNIIDIYMPKKYNVVQIYVQNDYEPKKHSRKVGEKVLKGNGYTRQYAEIVSCDILYTMNKDTCKITRRRFLYTIKDNRGLHPYAGENNNICDTPPFYQAQVRWSENGRWINFLSPNKDKKIVERYLRKEVDGYCDSRIIYIEE